MTFFQIFNKMQEASYNNLFHYKVFTKQKSVSFYLSMPCSMTDLSENITIIYRFAKQKDNTFNREIYFTLSNPMIRKEGHIITNDFVTGLNHLSNNLCREYKSFNESTNLIEDLYKIEKVVFDYTQNYYKSHKTMNLIDIAKKLQDAQELGYRYSIYNNAFSLRKIFTDKTGLLFRFNLVDNKIDASFIGYFINTFDGEVSEKDHDVMRWSVEINKKYAKQLTDVEEVFALFKEFNQIAEDYFKDEYITDSKHNQSL